MRTFTLGELAVMKYGKLPPKEILDAGCPIFTGYRVSGYAKNCLYENPMLVVVARGVGGTGDVKLSPPRSWITNLSIVLDLDETKADKQFLCYFLGQQSLKEKLNTGSAQAQITVNALTTFKITIPSLKVQRRIASILSTYDDLIRNNTRRIVILEEMARRIYEEWFVRFRFPGHEGVRMVESEFGLVPEGWTFKPFAQVATITMGLSPKGDTYNEHGGGTPLINGPVEFGERFTKQVKWTSAPTKLCNEGDLVVCVRGSTTGKYVKSDGVYCLGRGVCAISSKYQCFADLLFERELPVLLGQTGGSTFPSWTGPQLKAHPVLVATSNILAAFESHIEPMHAAVKVYSRQIQNLRITRDLLLPKLISGELDVSAMPAPESIAA